VPFHRAAELTSAQDVIPTGLPALDNFLGGLPARHTSLVASTSGAGATTLLHGILAAVTPRAPVLLFDPHDRFHPPAAAALGVHLPHVMRVTVRDPAILRRALVFALRTPACPLVVWDTPLLPPARLMDRLLPDVRASRSALLLVTEGVPPASPGITGASLIVRHERWEHARQGRPECTGRTILVAATDHRRDRKATLSVTFRFPVPIPSLLHPVRKGVTDDAGTTDRGALAAGDPPASRRTG
jgi:hypothetical protein